MRFLATVAAIMTTTLSACSGGESTGETTQPDPPAYASADPVSAGEAIFARCASCHSVEPGQNRVGPSMHGIVGRDIGSVDGFSYSSANQSFEGEWTAENLNGYLENPRQFMPGTTMAFAGIPNEQDRADLIAYLETLN